MADSARQRAASAVNAELTLLYWRIGHRIQAEVLAGRRANYGEAIVATLSRQLVAHYGRGFAEKNLRRMVQFASAFPEEQIVATLSQQLSWSHVVEILPLKDDLQREFYAQMCAAEHWSVRTLRERIDSALYQRTALSQQSQAQIEQELATLRDTQRMSPALLLRDPAASGAGSRQPSRTIGMIWRKASPLCEQYLKISEVVRQSAAALRERTGPAPHA